MIGFIIILILLTIVLMSIGSNDSSARTSKNHDNIYDKAPHKIKCRCLECNEVVMVPKQYLNDLTYRGPQTAKCPNCDWKMTKVKIIQEWGLD